MLIQKPKPKKAKPQQYHGHTIIELRNAKTGIRDRVESDNEFTGGIIQYIKGCGKWGNPWSNGTWSSQHIWQNLLGGIMLFDKKIEKVNGQYPLYMPAGTKMIANGAYGVINNGNPTEMMSFNANESSFNANALTFVYDATTSQGNGHIEAVSLCTETAGYIGMGNSVSNVAHGTKKSIATNMSYGYVRGSNMIVGNDYICTVTNAVTDNKITYTLLPYPSDNVNLFDYEKSYTVDIPSGLSGLDLDIAAGIGFRIFAIEKFAQTSTSFKAGLYDIQTDSWTVRTFALPSNRHWEYATSYGTKSYLKDGFFIYSPATYTGWDAIHSYFDVQNDETTEMSDVASHIAEIAPGLYMTATTQGEAIYDVENDTLYPTNGSHNFVGGSYSDGRIILRDNNYGYRDNYMYPNPFLLMTINNLDEPVQKTASQTMKVTYTVTPAA